LFSPLIGTAGFPGSPQARTGDATARSRTRTVGSSRGGSRASRDAGRMLTAETTGDRRRRSEVNPAVPTEAS